MSVSKEDRIEQMEMHLEEKFHLPREQIREMLPQFVEAVQGHFQRIEEALREGDIEEIGRAGHTMKGALLNLGFNDCAEVAMEIEKRGKSKEGSADYAALVRALRDKMGSLLK